MSLRPELPRPIPARIERLPIDRGYPVPWFVQWMDGDQPARVGEGKPEFRVMREQALHEAVRFGLCWVCGQRMGRHQSFVLGPMCAVNRTSAEPPSHFDCADWSARACPFLSRPHSRRREGGLPEGLAADRGIPILRNPGVALVWTTLHWRKKFDPNGGLLFDIGEPEHTRWYREGRPATRAEIEESIETGLPALVEVAEQEDALSLLEREVERARRYLPA